MMQGATLPVKYSLVASRDTVLEPSLEKTKQTGGGGAIVMKLDPFLILGVTQTVRTGRYKGQTIEDVGIETDTVFRPRWSDLQPDPTTNTQYDRIAASLARTGQENGQSKLHFVCEPFEIEKPHWDSHWKLRPLVLRNSLCSRLMERLLPLKQRRSRATTKQKFSIPVSAAGSALGNNRITIVGKTAGKQVLKTNRNALSDSVGLYQSPTTAPADGWNNLKGPWMIGNGVKYVSKIDSSIEAFFHCSRWHRDQYWSRCRSRSEPDLISSTCLSRAATVLKTFSSAPRAVMAPKTFNGISGGTCLSKGTIPFTTKSEKFSVSLKFTSDELLSSLVLLSTRSLSLLLEIFRLV
ncbi:hypothetical protein BASA62_009579 [Batrachochytrium salamandrivorans]|nr:hypothetical protein BASA62_009579 [Batrachochytrium salamandrivorans]